MRTRPGSIVIVVIVAAALMLVVFGAAVRGPWLVTPGSVLEKVGAESTPVPPPDPPTQTAKPVDQVRDQWDASWLPATITVIAVVTGFIVLLLLARMIILAIGRAREPSPEAERVRGGDVVATAELPHVETLRQGITSAQELLDDTRDPADAVIAAWIALEASAELSGVARSRAQTPTEFTVAVLSRTDAERAAVDDLLSLYLEARFSRHQVTDVEVARAGDCLARIAASLGVQKVQP